MILLCTCAASSAAFISSSSPSILRPSKHLDSSGVVCFAKKKSGATKKKPATSAARGFGASPTKAVKASPAARSTSATGDERWRAFEAWLAKSGATCDAVTLADCDGLRGVVTTRSVKAGEELLRIPRSIILDVARADASPVGGLWADVAEPLPGYARLALAVLYEKRLGDESSLLPYVELLPSATELLDGGGPAATWTDDELARTECGKLVADATRLRTRRDGGGHPALQPEALAARWQALGLAGSAPTADEVAWAVTVVTSRAYTIQEDAADVDGPVMSGLIPMVDMANHDGKLPPLTAKGIEPDGKNFVVLATAPMRKGAQVFLSYGPLPNMLLLQQWGFVLPQLASPPDMALVDISTWLEPGGEVAAALGCAAEEGKLMRERDGAPSAWQVRNGFGGLLMALMIASDG